jgi:hypothetical protein
VLHRDCTQVFGVGEHRQLVPTERTIAENVHKYEIETHRSTDHRVDLHRRAERQSSHPDCGTCRIWRIEVREVYLVHQWESRHVGQVDADTQDISETFAGSLQHGREVPQGLLGLYGNVSLYQRTGGRVLRDLTADERQLLASDRK